MPETDDLLARSQALHQRFQNADRHHRQVIDGAQRARSQARLTSERIRRDLASLMDRIGEAAQPG